MNVLLHRLILRGQHHHSHFVSGNRIGNMVSGWSVRTVVEQSGCIWGAIEELEKCVGIVSELYRS